MSSVSHAKGHFERGTPPSAVGIWRYLIQTRECFLHGCLENERTSVTLGSASKLLLINVVHKYSELGACV